MEYYLYWILSTFSWNGQIFSFIYCRVCYDDDFKVREKFGVFCYLDFVITERNFLKNHYRDRILNVYMGEIMRKYTVFIRVLK